MASREVRSKRRFYLHKRLTNDYDMAAVWRSKQEAEPGDALPAEFPLRAKLAAIGYTTVQDLDGADEHELRRVGIAATDAAKVMAALAELT